MDKEKKDGSVIGFLQVNETPLQVGNEDEVIRVYKFGGPDSGRDTRMYLHAMELEHLLEVARCSRSNRVILHRAGLVVTVRRSRDGHVYEEVRLECDQPVCEVLPTGFKLPTTNDEARRLAHAYNIKPGNIKV